MAMRQIKPLLRVILLTLAAWTTVQTSDLRAEEEQEIASSMAVWKLAPLARAYGYVRFFHPTAAARDVDWDRFLVNALQRVMTVNTPHELSETLSAVFAPVTSGVMITDGVPPLVASRCLTASEDHYIVQNEGVALNNTPNPDPEFPIYSSKRVLVRDGVPVEPLFAAVHACGVTIIKSLGQGLTMTLPLSVPARLDQPLTAMPDIDAIDLSILSPRDVEVRVIDVISTWAVIKHFYLYFDVVNVDWDAALSEALGDAVTAPTTFAHFMNLKHFIAKLGDGHGHVSGNVYATAQMGLPMIVDMVQGAPTVVGAQIASIHPGDIVLSIDGVPMSQLIERAKSVVSGSDQWKTFRALRSRFGVGWGDQGTSAVIDLLRGDEVVHVLTTRSYPEYKTEFERPDFFEMSPGTWYVNLSKVEMSAMTARINELAAARGIIFDLRGYPAGNHEIIQHLTYSVVFSAPFRVPQVLYPDLTPAPAMDNGPWELEPRSPKLGGTIVFLTDGRAISYAESFLGIIDHYKLGEIIATSNTAGANGNVNSLITLGGFTIGFTGMLVTKHDGTTLFGRGISPTIRVERTRLAAQESRDELVEKALEVINRSH